MRIGINLASHPYEDEGRFYRQWGAALAFMVLFTLFLIFISFRHYQDSSKSWESAREAEARLEELRKEEAEAQQILAQPQYRGTRDRSQFLNQAILRKSFSWTRLMEDLEKVMPAGLRVSSIAPTVDQHNRTTLKLEVEGETRDGAIQLLRNMEKSQHFRSPELTAENHEVGTKGYQGVKSGIVTSYVPAESLESNE
jgi:type IV pilus assembly protein PilN